MLALGSRYLRQDAADDGWLMRTKAHPGGLEQKARQPLAGLKCHRRERGRPRPSNQGRGPGPTVGSSGFAMGGWRCVYPRICRPLKKAGAGTMRQRVTRGPPICRMNQKRLRACGSVPDL